MTIFQSRHHSKKNVFSQTKASNILCTFVVACFSLTAYINYLFTQHINNDTNKKDALQASSKPFPLSLRKQTPLQKNFRPLELLVKTKRGPENSWELVDWSNPISPEEEEKFSCEMTPFVAAKSGQKTQMCVHTFDEVITEFVKRDLRWRDCNSLPDLWVAEGALDDTSIYIDIGANIGSCVMEMLLSTNATIIAFEPHPMNVYNIKKSLSKLGKEYQDRLLLFPIGLGSSQLSSTIYSGHDNMGNSQIGKSVKDWGSQKFDKRLQFEVFVERLDSVLDESKIKEIRFVKMDCQGFECNAFDGMGSLAEKIKAVRFEHSGKFLQAQECSDLVPRVTGLGFDVFKYDDGSGQLGQKIVSNPGMDTDLMAKRTVAT
jgi:FkbM family methyltransferase